jgi:transcription initiation factor IIE alpha subunit
MNPEIDENEKLIQKLYDEASDDAKHVLQQVLEAEVANLHLANPLGMRENIVSRINTKIYEEQGPQS